MVSSLSSRLLGVTAAASSLSASGKSDIDASTRGSKLSGYSADRESAADISPPGFIGFQVKEKRRLSSPKDEQAKRRKLNEKQFAAANAREDLIKAKLPVPKIRTKNPRAIPLAKIDMSKVKLITSDEAKASPFLTDFCTGDSVYNSPNLNLGNIIHDLMSVCKSAYTSTGNDIIASECESTASTSSFSDTASDVSDSPSPVLVINARLDDLVKEKPLSRCSTPPEQSHTISCPRSLCISMEEAITVFSEARLLMLSSAPYTVIHANAAFLKLTGLVTGDILGKPFLELLEASSLEKLSLPSCAAESVAGRDSIIRIAQETTAKSTENPSYDFLQCIMNVKPIITGGSNKRPDTVEDVRELNDVTHFAVDLVAMQDDVASQILAERRTAGVATMVTG